MTSEHPVVLAGVGQVLCERDHRADAKQASGGGEQRGGVGAVIPTAPHGALALTERPAMVVTACRTVATGGGVVAPCRRGVF